MFLEGTYGFIRNELTGGNENGILMNESANRLNGLAGFPLLYPDAGARPESSYAYEVLQDVKPPFWDGTKMNLPPDVQLGWPHRRLAAEPALSRLAEHQPDAGRVDQLDEDRRPPRDQGRASTTTTASRRRTSAAPRSRGPSNSTTTATTRSTPASAMPTPRSACSTSTRRARSSSRAACSTTTSRATSRTTGRSTAA